MQQMSLFTPADQRFELLKHGGRRNKIKKFESLPSPLNKRISVEEEYLQSYLFILNKPQIQT